MLDDDDDDGDEGLGRGQLDYRFSLANERTFLAWVRTALALLVAGVAVVHLDGNDGLHTAMGLGTVALSAASVLLAYRRWWQVESAMESGTPVPDSLGIPLMAVAMASVAVGMGIAMLL